MCQAGEAAFAILRKQWPSETCITLFCGTGNNGGDGYVVARLAVEAGLSVTVIQLGDPKSLRAEAAEAYEAMVTRGVSVTPYSSTHALNKGVIVDAMLGIGVDRTLEGAWFHAVELINRSILPVLAIDIPSGLDADRGVPLGTAVKADVTVTMIAHKRGCFTADGPDHVGTLELAPLDIEPLQQHACSCWQIQSEQFSSLLTRRRYSTHKGEVGHLLVIGGGPGMGGAARITAEAGARTGAGLISVATHPEHAATLNNTRPELMVHAISNGADLSPLLEQATAVAIGPGLGQTDWAVGLLQSVLNIDKPIVADADALNLIAQQKISKENWILTPHPGEAARLLQTTTTSIQQDRFDAVTRLQQRYGGVMVLKGNGTLITNGNGNIHLCPAGNPGMASGGMGDLLTGIIAGLIAQRIAPTEAAMAGVCIHATAGDLAAADGERGMLATDLLPFIRTLVNPSSQS